MKIRIVDHFQLNFIPLLLVIINDNILAADAGATPTCPSRSQVSSRERSLRISFDMYKCIRDPNSTFYEELICQSKITILIMLKIKLI